MTEGDLAKRPRDDAQKEFTTGQNPGVIRCDPDTDEVIYEKGRTG